MMICYFNLLEDIIMSHWRTYSNDVLVDTVDKHLVSALEEMGLGINENIKSVRNTWGNAEVDFALTKNGVPISIGFKRIQEKNGTKLELRGDFYATGLNESVFMDQLSQKYQKNDIICKLTDNRWTIENCVTNEEGEIIIDAYEYVY